MPRPVQRATAADVPYSMSSGCATTQSTRWKDSSGRAGNAMSAILPEPFPVGDGQAGHNIVGEQTAVGGAPGRHEHVGDGVGGGLCRVSALEDAEGVTKQI